MPRKSLPAILALTFLALIFLTVVYQLLWIRLQEGDSYPPYSSFRSDPLGTKVLWESLGRLEGYEVSRNTKPLDEITGLPSTTLIHAGITPGGMNLVALDEISQLERLARTGATVIIAFVPLSKKPFLDYQQRGDGDDATPADAPEEKSEPDPDRETDPSPHRKQPVRLMGWEKTLGKLGVEFHFEEVDPKNRSASDDRITLLAVRQKGPEELPEEIDLHTVLSFTKLAPEWSVLYAAGEGEERPVIIQRRWGRGQIIFLAEAYVFSNQALHSERSSPLLSFLLGKNRRIIFNETQFGIMESPGIAGLIRQYHLEGFVLGGLLLGVLFIWRNTSSLVPPADFSRQADGVVLQSSTATAENSLSRLLQRHLPVSRLLEVCVGEWKKSFARSLSTHPDKRARMDRALEEIRLRKPVQPEDLVRAYRSIMEILNRKKL
ncbi:MAG: DUF4350 domain-containing protein [Verrucomicrobiae bacterium]|nr:DUF4350 domain-containing protein [Verrucomicrobiae bacterium]